MPTEDRNVEGLTTAITTFSTARWWGRYWLPVLFWAVGRFPSLTKRLRSLDFIYFAHWTIVREPPYNGAPQSAGRLRYARLFFASNFTGSWDEYIKAFANKLRTGMSAFWSSSFGFPGPLPVQPFMAYIRENEFDSPYYWSAYPDATVTQILRALRLAGHDGTVPVSRPFMAMCPTRAGLDGELYDALAALTDGPLAASSRTHMGRMVVVHDFHQDAAQPQADHLDGPYLVLTANLDGDLDTWLDEVCSHPAMHDILRRCIGCPDTLAGLKGYLLHNEVPVGLSYAAYPTATVGDVKAALAALPAEAESEWTSDTPVVRVHIARGLRIIREQYDRYLATKPAVAQRDQHPAGQCIHGTLTIREDLASELRQGIAAKPGAMLPLVARFSANAPARLPWRRDAHGAALMVPGQHFVLTNTEGFFAKDAEDSVELVKARGEGGRGLVRYFLPSIDPRRWRLRELRNMAVAVTRYVPNPLAIDYVTPSALGWGPLAGKLSLLTHTKAGRRRPFHRPDWEAAMREQLATQSASFDLAVRIHTDAVREPLDDPTRPWPAGEPVVVATAHFPSQKPTTGEHLSFNLRHCLPEHASIDEVSLFREAVYGLVSDARHAYNRAPAQTEPAP